MGEYAKAEPLYLRSLRIREKALGEDHPDIATSLNNLAGLYRLMGDYAKAEPLYLRSLQIREKALEEDHPDITTSLNSLAGLYVQMGDYAKAEPLYLRSLQIREKALGENHPDFATSLNNLAALYSRMGDYAKAEPLYLRSLQTLEKAPGEDLARSLNNLATLYSDMGDYGKAEPLYLRSRPIWEKALGEDHPDIVASLDGLAGLYRDMGDYTKAEPLYLRSRTIREKALGENHPDFAASLNNLALLYSDMGDYAKAEPLYLRSRTIREKALGENHPDFAASLGNLAGLYVQMGDYAKAEPLYLRSLRILEKALGENHPDFARSLNALAVLYRLMGDYAKAEPLCLRSLTIREKALGEDHPDIALSLGNLAGLYAGMGDYAKAEPLCLRSLQIREKALGDNHPDFARSLNNLAGLYARMGDYAKAGPLCLRSLKILEKALGENHPDIATSLRNLAWLQLCLNEPMRALEIARKQATASERVLCQILSFTSDSQRMAYVLKQSPYDLFGTLGAAADLAKGVLRNRGIVLDSLLEDELAARESNDPVVRQTLDNLRSAGRRLVRLQMETPKDLTREDLKRREAERENLEQQVETMQKALARNVEALGRTRRALQITVPEVQAVLAKDTLLLEFVRYAHYLGKAQSEPRYGVVLIAPAKVALGSGKAGEPVWVSLGSAEAIERNLTAYQQAMRGGGTNGLLVLKTLYAQLFEPIRQQLPPGTKTLILSPDAELHFISFATLIGESGRFLAEDYTVEHVASGRDLVLGPGGKKKGRRLAAFANPAFGQPPALARAGPSHPLQLAMLPSDRRDYAGVRLAPLPNTAIEAGYLRDKSAGWKLEGVVYEGAEASEAEVRAVESPHILHLATHGFFLPDTAPTHRPDMGMQMMGEDRLPVVWRNPMQRSGLAFAGAQLTLEAWKRGETPSPENDGILMAQEVGTMDLNGTWLVVLSACDTGAGEARAGEGVLGLRRGFIQAGAQNLLMTLWPVSDRWTMEMMEAFYERALRDGAAPKALAEVQRDYLVKLREQKNAVMAARLAGPFVLTFQRGPAGND